MIVSPGMKCIIATFLIFWVSNSTFTKQALQTSSDLQKEKLRIILQVQDRRTIHRDKLISFFTDPDPVIRSRAALAWGSLQDTSVLSRLVELLWDQNADVEVNAAFAIGQTAGLLCGESKKVLEHDVLWVRLDKMKSGEMDGVHPQDRCIEELGKFADEDALRELVGRYGNIYPVPHQDALIMSIARFAIRGITDPVATEFILRRTKDGQDIPWQVVYALQRIGDRKEIRDNLVYLAGLFRQRDPLFRMYLATLLGKVKDSATSLDPLSKLAEFDADWRVRVNAVKALANFNLNAHPALTDLFRKLFSDENPNVAIAAINGFGLSGVKEDSTEISRRTFEQLSRISENRGNGYVWQVQGEAALSLAKLTAKKALMYIHLEDAGNPFLREELMNALGGTGSLSVANGLFQIAGGEDSYQARAAIEGLDELCRRNRSNQSLRDSIYDCLLGALASPDVALRTTAASLLGDSLYMRSSAVSNLVDALRSSHVPDDIEALQEIASTLGKLKDTRAIEALTSLLQEHDRSVTHAAAEALHSITGKDYQSDEVVDFEPYYSDFDFGYLDSLPSVIRVKVETTRGDIILELNKQSAPFTVMNFLKLATMKKFYNGKIFHRVVPNFVIQGGDPRGDGWGGPGYTIRSEFSPETYQTGAVGIASAGKDTEGSQFFITQSPQPHLDGRYTLIGKVVAGLDVVSKIMVDDHIYNVDIQR
jgi:cyclophilin family peptidyl-prolyl cis-trans isomerase/HEAT repeat protein